jgi:uncharacterized protein (TIGR02466 family)
MSVTFTDTLIDQFPTPVLSRQCRDVTALNSALAALIRELSKTEPNDAPGTSTYGGYQTDTNFLYREHPAVKQLQQLIYQAVHAFLPRYLQSSLLAAPQNVEARLWGWAVLMRPGDYNVPHVHPDAHVSGVYYVEVPEMLPAESAQDSLSGSLVFLDPRSSASMYRLTGHRRTHSCVPTAGLLVVFPSYHMHGVFPYRSPGERISIAFNVRLTLT